MPAHFPLGRVVITRNALNTLPTEDVHSALARHAAGDWGEALCPEDREENELSLKEGFRLLSAYHTPRGKVWIITEADRSVTTVLFPADY